MKKTLLASAIAATLAAGSAQAVTLYDANGITFGTYGKLQLELQNADGENNVQNNGTRFGFTGTQQLNNGLEAFANFEFRFNPGARHDSYLSTIAGHLVGEDEDHLEVRNSYIGVRGGFGEIKAGNFDSVTYSFVTGTADIMENAGWSSLDTGGNNGQGHTIAYVSPSFGGLTLGLGVKHYSSDESANNPAFNSVSGDEVWNIQLAASFAINEALTVAIAFDQNDGDGGYFYQGIDYDFATGTVTDVNPVNSDESIITAAVTYAVDTFNVGLVYEKEDDQSVINLLGGYNYGSGSIYGLVGFLDDGDDTGTDFAVGVNYNLADNFYVYGEAAVGNDDVSGMQDAAGDGITVVTLGAKYAW